MRSSEPRPIGEDRSVDGVLVRTPAGLLAKRHPRCLQPEDRIEARPIVVDMAASEETRRCSTCGELLPWSPRSALLGPIRPSAAFTFTEIATLVAH